MRGLLILAAALGLWAGGAHAQQVCNETSFILEAAVAYPEGGQVTAEGWVRLRPGECQAAGPDAGTPRFVYARSSTAHRGGQREWQGLEPFCVAPDDAEFVVEAEQNCEAAGLVTKFFKPVEPEAESTTFVEQADYGERARLAGLQRLAGDAGDPVSLDRISDRAATRAAETVLANEGGLRPDGDAAWIDWLETIAAGKREAEGVTVCNEAGALIWTAHGRRNGDSWTSRGWWSVEPGECAKIYGEPLTGEGEYYLYAGLSGDEEDQMLTAATEIFCLAPTRFAISGRETCTDRGYMDGRFLQLAPGGRAGLSVTLTEEDFGPGGMGPLRR